MRTLTNSVLFGGRVRRHRQTERLRPYPRLWSVSSTRGQPALARASIGSVATIEVSADASAWSGGVECRS